MAPANAQKFEASSAMWKPHPLLNCRTMGAAHTTTGSPGIFMRTRYTEVRAVIHNVRQSAPPHARLAASSPTPIRCCH